MKNPLIIKFNTEDRGKGDASTSYFYRGKLVFKSYSFPNNENIMLDANFLSSFLGRNELADFKKSLGEKGLDLNSFVEVAISHGSHTFDNMDPNYFTSYTYAMRMRSELDNMSYSDIIKIGNNQYELVNDNSSTLPLMKGLPILHFRTLLTINSDNSFTLERYGDDFLYFKIRFYDKKEFNKFTDKVVKLEELNYRDNFVSPEGVVRKFEIKS